MQRRFKAYAAGIAWIVAPYLAAACRIIMRKRFNVAPAGGDVAELAGIRCLRMRGRFIRTTVTT